MMKMIMKIRPFLFLFFGVALAAAIFWLPTVFAGGNDLVLPMLFPGPWYLLAIPYLLIFALVYGLLAGAYHLLKRPFLVSLVDVAWILLGLYLSLTFFFHIVGVAVTAGTLTI